MRDIEPVVAAEAEEEVVARDPGDRLRLEAEQLADAVVLVDDVVAGAQVGERLEGAAAEPTFLRHATAEDLMVREKDEPEVAPDEAAACGRDREQHLGLVGQRLSGLEQARGDAPQEILRAQRLPAVRERDDNALPGAHERGQLVLGLGEAACSDRGALRLEGERLRLRERVELGRPVERRLFEDAVVLPHAAHPVRLEDEIGNAVERRDEILREPFRLGVDEVDAPLGSRIDDGLVDGMERALREGGEGSDGLDLVAEELDAQRLSAGRGEDVHDASAHGELAAVVGAVGPRVAGEGERLGQGLHPGLRADTELDRLRPRFRRRHRLGERPGGGAHEPAAGEDVERAGTLADEVRRRLQA